MVVSDSGDDGGGREDRKKNEKVNRKMVRKTRTGETTTKQP